MDETNAGLASSPFMSDPSYPDYQPSCHSHPLKVRTGDVPPLMVDMNPARIATDSLRMPASCHHHLAALLLNCE